MKGLHRLIMAKICMPGNLPMHDSSFVVPYPLVLLLVVVRPPPPSVDGTYSPLNITAGQSSQLLYSSANATVLGLVCNGIQFVAVQSPSLYLNQSWYWFPQTWSSPGTQYCNIHAHNSLGEVAVREFALVVAPVGTTPSGGGTSGEIVYPPGTPGAPEPTGSGSGSGRPQGYTNPVTGVVYSNPEGTQVCSNCNTSEGLTTNDKGTPPESDPPSDDGESEAGGYSNSGM